MEQQRFPISVRLIGVLHKEKSKLFMTSALWTDHSDIIVYRTFGEFKKLHKRMTKMFPPTNKLRKSDRIIPRFQEKHAWQADQGKNPTKSLQCLKFLQKYCNELLSCDPRVCQSTELIQFFHPKDQDLEPEFSKNGILIMPTDDENGTGAGHGNSGNVTQPFVTETYRCVAPYETKDTRNKPFKVAVDEKVDVLIKDKSGWWLVEKEDKRMAWFPAPYLENVDEDQDEDQDDASSASFERGMRYTATKSYKATNDDEINVPVGAVVQVLEKSDNGWWLVSYSGKAGYVPAMYLQTYNYPHILIATQLQDQRAPSRLELPPPGRQQRSSSQGSLQLPPPARSPSPGPRRPLSKQRSNSLTIFTQQAPAPVKASRPAAAPGPARPAPPPVIRVEMDGQDDCGRTLSIDSEGSDGSDGSDFSFREELDMSLESLCLSMSLGANDERLSRTPPPSAAGQLSPSSLPESKLVPSVSDPSLYKAPKSPKVPPRPRAQEILTRCSSLTRSKTASGTRSPTQTEILGR
ncbi:NADPH oxidase organizer 1a [Betta splendens]|uniref:NADPH oxidase organizer 1a n=1 Tax=Betta splendens TaxID=158456 RepID=A0A6P7N643_BETSP|nr:NADPH oxidase organizer 1a [Betta splendens]